MSIRIKDKTGFMQRVRSIDAKYPQASRAILTELAAESAKKGKEDITKNGARGLTPVDKANLVSTLRVEVTPDRIVYVAGGMQGGGSPSVYVDYAGYVNNGTSKMTGRYYMEGSVNRALEDENAFSKKILKSWLEQK